MEQDRKEQNNQQSKNQNPTLNSPGSKVPDYGNTAGGVANEELERKHGKDSSRQGNSSIPLDEDETIGNP